MTKPMPDGRRQMTKPMPDEDMTHLLEMRCALTGYRGDLLQSAIDEINRLRKDNKDAHNDFYRAESWRVEIAIENVKLRKVVEAARIIQQKVIRQHELPPFALYGEEAAALEKALYELDEEKTND